MNGVEILREMRKVVSSQLPSFQHVIGLRDPSDAKASDYPFVFYSVKEEEIDKTQQYKTTRIVLLVGIRNSTFNQDTQEYEGIVELFQVIETVKSALKENYTLNGSVITTRIQRSFTDLGVSHPFYHAEIHAEVISRA